MLNREAVKNRINGLVREYEDDGIGTNLGDAMAEILKAIEYHNMRLLTLEELKSLNGIPVWLQSTDEWLRLHEECDKVERWFIPNIYNNHFYKDEFPWLWTENTYGKYWNCYERIL